MVYIPPPFTTALYKTFLFNLRFYPIFCLYTSAYTFHLCPSIYIFYCVQIPFSRKWKTILPFLTGDNSPNASFSLFTFAPLNSPSPLSKYIRQNRGEGSIPLSFFITGLFWSNRCSIGPFFPDYITWSVGKIPETEFSPLPIRFNARFLMVPYSS